MDPTRPAASPTRAADPRLPRRSNRRARPLRAAAVLLVAAVSAALLVACEVAGPPASGVRPTAHIDATPPSGSADAPVDVTFSGAGSNDPDGTIVSYTWSVDGQTDSGVQTVVSFLGEGSFTVRLTVTDDQGLTGTASVDYVVGTATPGTDLVIAPQPMNGTTQATATVSAGTSWSLSTSDPGIVSFQPSTGTGDATVTLTVDPTTLSPGSYTFDATLSAGSDVVHRSVDFSFPDLQGTVTTASPLRATPAASTTPFPDAPLGRSAAAAAPIPAGPARLLVGVARATARGVAGGTLATQAVDAVASTPGVTVERRFAAAGVLSVRADDAATAAARLRAQPGVRYVEAVQRVEPFTNDTYFGDQWNLGVVRAEAAWGTATGAGVRVAVLDHGLDPAHADLAANVAGSYDAVHGTSPATFDSACNAHGTHVAGIIAAVADNATGIAGIAHGADLLLVDLGDHASSCTMDTVSLVAGLDWVTNGGSPRADVINLSLGFDTDSQAVHDAVTAARDAGITVVAATGNSGAAVAYPAAYPEAIAVGATGYASDAAGSSVAPYSNAGPQVWVVAPGGSNDGTPSHGVLSTWYTSTADDVYAYEIGTSMASPAVAAVAALMLSTRPGATPQQIAQALADGATDLGPTGRDDASGYGLVDAPAAIAALAGTAPPSSWILRVSDGRELTLPANGAFSVPDVPTGSVTLTAGTDENRNGVLGDPGEYYGQVTVDVQFDAPLGSIAVPVSLQ